MAPSRSPRSHSVRLSVRLSGTKCSKALNLHLSLIGLSQVSLGLVSGQSQVSLRSVSGVRSVSGQSQVSLFAYFVRQTEPKILRLVILRGIVLGRRTGVLVLVVE